MNKKDEVERIFERFKYEALAVVCAEPAPVAIERTWPEWLTEEQLMEYWQLDSNSGLRKWRQRPADQFPLPCGSIGGGKILRYNRTDVDQWFREEAARQRLGKSLAEKPKREGLSLARPQGEQ